MIDKMVEALKKAEQPRSEFVELMEKFNDPYLVLIGCILSLRTNDKTTYPATLRMLELAKTPKEMMGVNVDDLSRAIYPVGFYENKAKQIIELSRQIVEELNGKVPDEIEELIRKYLTNEEKTKFTCIFFNFLQSLKKGYAFAFPITFIPFLFSLMKP